jgi:hypothetical protein
VISVAFAREGCNVAINYFNRLEPAQKVQNACQEQGVKAVVVKAVRCLLNMSKNWTDAATGYDVDCRGEASCTGNNQTAGWD